jgi:hypothetical protein
MCRCALEPASHCTCWLGVLTGHGLAELLCKARAPDIGAFGLETHPFDVGASPEASYLHYVTSHQWHQLGRDSLLLWKQLQPRAGDRACHTCTGLIRNYSHQLDHPEFYNLQLTGGHWHGNSWSLASSCIRAPGSCW